MLLVIAVLIATFGVSLTSRGPQAGAANCTGSPATTSPTAFARFSTGWTGPVTVDFSKDCAGSERRVLVECVAVRASFDPATPRSYSWAADLRLSSSTTTRTWTIPPIEQHADCRVVISDETGYSGSLQPVRFTILNDFFASIDGPAAFYPTVRDGYLDTATVSWTIDPAYPTSNHAQWGVCCSHIGEPSLPGGVISPSATQVTWNGRFVDGTLAPERKYIIQVDFADSYNYGHWLEHDLELASGIRTGLYDKTLVPGHSRKVRAERTGQCVARVSDRHGGSVLLKCNGRGYAQVKFTFDLPYHPDSMKRSIAGIVLGGSSGRLIRRWGWVDHNTIRALVRVTGERAFRAYGASVRFRYPIPY